MSTASTRPIQLPLIVHVESDDVYLQQRPDVLWFTLLTTVDWIRFAEIAAQYYEGLWQFNAAQARSRAERAARAPQPNPETKDGATLRLLFGRATMQDDVPVLAGGPPEELPLLHVSPGSVAPGVVPTRLAGRRPKCFFALFKAFTAIAVKGRAPEPEFVYEELRDNPSFARACGFTLPDPEVGYRQSDVPGLRKIEQFDQIMTDQGLWDRASVQQVAANLKAKAFQAGSTLVHDTTHYEARSALSTVELPDQRDDQEVKNAEQADPPSKSTKKRKSKRNRRSQAKTTKKRKRKSQAKTTKNCRCKDRATCPHEWVLADAGAGTVVKAGRKKYWAHKASTLCFAGQEGVLLDARAMTDAASHDSNSVVPHLESVFERHPELQGLVTRMLDDSAADDAKLKAELAEQFGVELLAPPNPRNRKPITSDLPRGLDRVTNLGVPVCRAGFPFDFLGCRHDEERFLFRAPDTPPEGKLPREAFLLRGPMEEGKPVCEGCTLKSECCRDGAERRHVSIAFERLPWIDPNFPQLSVSFAKEMAQRTVIERLHKLMKEDYGDGDLTKRGTKAFQARLDKTKLAMHLVLGLPSDDSS